jgi:conjugative transposon TraM protein
MVVPFLALPFVTMIFWALGGGQVAPAQATSLNTGLNLNLPDAHFSKGDVANKLSIYEQAKTDSLKFREARENDPYFNLAMLSPDSVADFNSLLTDGPGLRSNTDSKSPQPSIDETEKRVNERLDQLTKELSKAEHPTPKKAKTAQVHPIQSAQFSSDIDRLESMMEMMNNGDQRDPEMQEISGMLDKILDIQNPERVRERIKDLSVQNRDKVYAVETIEASDDITFLGRQSLEDTVTNQFFGLDELGERTSDEANAIPVVIHETQELVSGSTVKLRLLADIFINGQLIPKDHFLFGKCDLNAERLTISINSIRSDKFLFPVDLTAFDLDGAEGLYIPGAIARDAAKQSSDQMMQGVQFMSLNPSIGAQAAAAGLQAAKGFFGRKVKTIRVTVKTGHKVLLRDSNIH